MNTHVDLFSGIGGFTLAAHANGLRTVAFCEIDQRCRNFLSNAWPGVDINTDIKEFDGTAYNGAFLLTAGVPCQPASRAGKQRGAADDRWLWPEAIRVLGQVKPTWAIFENPPGIGDVGLAGILADVEAQGYEVRVFSIPACAVGAPHRRERYWIVANRTTKGLQGSEARQKSGIRAGYRGCDNNLADNPQRENYGGEPGNLAGAQGCGQGCDSSDWDDSQGYMADTKETKHERERPIPNGQQNGFADGDQWNRFVWLPCADGKFRRAPDDSFGLVDGLQCPLPEMVGPFHRSLLAALGNSIVPQVAYEIIKAIKEATWQSKY